VSEESAIGAVAGRDGLRGLGVEDEKARSDVDVVLVQGLLHIGENPGFGEDEFDSGDAHAVTEFGFGV